MDKYICSMCGHVYDPAIGERRAFNTVLCNTATMELYQCKPGDQNPYIESGVDFAKLPADFRCPTCGYPKTYFRKAQAETLASIRTINY